MNPILTFRVPVPGLGLEGLGFRGLGFKGFRFRGLGFRGLGFRGLGSLGQFAYAGAAGDFPTMSVTILEVSTVRIIAF